MKPGPIGWSPLSTLGDSVEGEIGGIGAEPVRIVDAFNNGLFTSNTDPSTPGVDPRTGQESPVGTDVGFGVALRRYIQANVPNGEFMSFPSNATGDIDNTYNPMPFWRWVGPDSGSIRAYMQGTDFAAGLVVTGTDMLNGDTGYMECIVPIAGTFGEAVGLQIMAHVQYGNGGSSNIDVYAELRYLDQDATVVTEAATEDSITLTNLFGETRGKILTTGQRASQDAQYARIRVGMRANADLSGTNTFLLYDVRAVYGQDQWILIEGNPTASTDRRMHRVYAAADNNNDDRMYAVMHSGQTQLLNTQLIALQWTLLNAPANATTQMQPADNALPFTTTTMEIPWGGSIVGVSYRADRPTTGTFDIRVTVAGSEVWTAHNNIGSGSAAADSATAAIGTYKFNAGQNLGMNIVTNATYSPTTGDIACILWLALDYTGT